MPRPLKLYIAGLVAISTILLIATSSLIPLGDQIAIQFDGTSGVSPAERLLGLTFWVIVTMLASAMPVTMPRGVVVAVSGAPMVAAMALGGPTAIGWVALLGTIEWREVRGRIPWYGTVANHAGGVAPAVVGGVVAKSLGLGSPVLVVDFTAVLIGAVCFLILNIFVVEAMLSIRSGQSIRVLLYADIRTFAASHFALAPLGWLMARTYAAEGSGGWWATLLFALPLYTTRLAYQRFNDMREMFTQTIGALAEAVDKRDPFTSKHSRRVMEIARDIGREMRLGDADLEALEWGGLLHDVGKIGVRDDVLLKQERLTKDERIKMNSHPVLGEEIIRPVTRLSRELPIIRHHHEWYNGSGYPDRLIGDEIPLNARVLHVADAFEAMTAARPYRMTPLTAEQALGELRKFAGIQFDPRIVDAFVHTSWVEGVPDPGRTMPSRPIPLIAQVANQAVTPTPSANATAGAAPTGSASVVPGTMPPA
jgi:putative nucleotidyltransferase with HDIG domain